MFQEYTTMSHKRCALSGENFANSCDRYPALRNWLDYNKNGRRLEDAKMHYQSMTGTRYNRRTFFLDLKVD